MVWANSGARADPKVLPSQGRFSVGAQARVSRLLGFLDKNGSPWGQRASQIRVRARADYLLLFIFFTMVIHHTFRKTKKNDLGEFGCARGPKAQVPPIRVRAHQSGCARARIIFYFLFYFVWYPPKKDTMPKKKKVAAGKPGARAHPNQYITTPSPYWSSCPSA